MKWAEWQQIYDVYIGSTKGSQRREDVDTGSLDSSESDPEDSTQQRSVSCGYFVFTQSAHHANWDGLRTV